MPNYFDLQNYFDIPIALIIIMLSVAIVQLYHSKSTTLVEKVKAYMLLGVIMLTQIKVLQLFLFGLTSGEKTTTFYVMAVFMLIAYESYVSYMVKRVFGSNKNKRFKHLYWLLIFLILSEVIIPVILELFNVLNYQYSLIFLEICVGYFFVLLILRNIRIIKDFSVVYKTQLFFLLLFIALSIFSGYIGQFDLNQISLNLDDNFTLKLSLLIAKNLCIVIFAIFTAHNFATSVKENKWSNSIIKFNRVFIWIMVAIIPIFLLGIVYFTENERQTLVRDLETNLDLTMNVIEKDELLNMKGNYFDKFDPLYMELKSKIEKVVELSDLLSRVAIVNTSGDGKYYYFMEVLKDKKDVGLDPGTSDNDVPIMMKNSFIKQSIEFTGEIKDENGVWQGVYGPILTNNSTKYLLGVFATNGSWMGHIFSTKAESVVIMLFIFILVLLAYDITISYLKLISFIKESQIKFKKIFDHTSDGILLLRGIEIVDVNKAAIKMFRISYRLLLKKNLIDLSVPIQNNSEKSDGKFQSIIEDLIKTDNISFEWNFKVANRVMSSMCSLSKFRIQAEDFLLIVINDISKVKKIDAERMNHINQLERLNKLMVGRELKMIELKQQIAQDQHLIK